MEKYWGQGHKIGSCQCDQEHLCLLIGIYQLLGSCLSLDTERESVSFKDYTSKANYQVLEPDLPGL